MSGHEDFEEAVRERAYSLWQQAGAPESSDLYFWLQAEAEIRAERQAGDAQDARARSAEA